MASFGEAAARGLESGFGMGMAWRRQQEVEKRAKTLAERDELEYQERREDRALQRERLAKQDARLDKQDERQARLDARQDEEDALAALDAQLKEAANEGAGYLRQYGSDDKIPEDVRRGYSERVAGLRGQRDKLLRQRYERVVKPQMQEAADLWSRVQTGQVDIDSVDDATLYKTLTAQMRRDLSDFLAQDGAPSKVQQAGLDLMAGIETGNEGLTLQAANVLLAPELRTGVGQPGRDGREILKKEIIKLVPHPQDPKQFVPVLKVTVRREDGAIGSYIAPVTENRSSDPADNVRTISIDSAMERVGQLTSLAEALNSPAMRQRLERGQQAAGADAKSFLEQFYSIGGTAPQRKVVREWRELGGHALEREVDDATGSVLSERVHRKTAAPRQEVVQEDPKMRGLAAALRRGTISKEDYEKGVRRHLLGEGKGGMDDPKKQFDAEDKLRDEHTKQSGTFVKIRDAYGKVQAAASDPSAAGDIALIFGYMKILDPDSVVREGEFATAQNAASIPDRVRNAYNKALEGTRLNDQQRNDMLQQAKKVYAEQKKGQDKLDRTYTDLSKRYGLNPENVVQKFVEDDTPTERTKTVDVGGQKVQAMQAPDGKFYVRLQNGKYAEVRE